MTRARFLWQGHTRYLALLGLSLGCGEEAAGPNGNASGASNAQGGFGQGSGATNSGGMFTTGAGTTGGTLVGAGGVSGVAGSTLSQNGCAPPANPDSPPEKLSQTGCMQTTTPTQMAAFVIPYEVNSPLWSDSADKTRGLVVPAGQKIHVQDCSKQPGTCAQGAADTGKWLFPVGTVFIKSFSFEGKLVETRLFVRPNPETWVGYSYQWNEAQTEATIVPDERRKVMFNTGQRSIEWNYPSRSDCMKCHNPQVGFSLGPETAQMNRLVGGRNQLDTFSELGLFDAPPSTPYAEPLVTPYDDGELGGPIASATLEQKARSYLHANCAFCHRPDGDFTKQDLRYGIVLKDMGICNTTPEKGDAGVADAVNLAPGTPAQSVLWLRMNSLEDRVRMPQIATFVVDDLGQKLIADWISSIAACPQ